MEFKYYVGKLGCAVHSSVPRYVCIPSSWIRGPILEKKTSVSFPNEEYAMTVQRIIAGQNLDHSWPVLVADIILGCGNLSEAQKKAVELCIGIASDLEQNSENQCAKAKETPIKRAKTSVSIDDKTHEGSNKRPKLIIPDDITKSKHFKTFDAPNKMSKSKGTTEASTPSGIDVNIEHEKAMREKQVLKKLSNVFETMQEAFEGVTDTLKNMNKTVDAIKTTMYNSTIMINDFLDKGTIPTRKQSISGTDTEKESTRRSRRFDEDQPKEFLFPDDSEKSSKWTLRHKEVTQGLIELLKKSGVYVREAELNNLDYSRSPTEAAFMLLKEIYSDEALRQCSLIGQKGTDRPGLDKYSRKVLMMYLNEYCVKRNWKIDEPTITISLRNKLKEYRNAFS